MLFGVERRLRAPAHHPPSTIHYRHHQQQQQLASELCANGWCPTQSPDSVEITFCSVVVSAGRLFLPLI